ncbi:condensation domain-containing protein [Streptomyces radiopugnans]|nr:condensation domain-containing protein [Streptomyces radiopugnans]
MRFVQGEDGWGQTDTGWSEQSAAQAAHVPLIDLSALPEERRERTVRQMAAEMRDEFDPTVSPLVKVALFDLGPDRRRLVWLSHLLVADLRSLQVLLGEFSAAVYQLRDGDRADLLPPTRPFPRWVERAAGHTVEAPPSDGAVPLPTDFRRRPRAPAVDRARGGRGRTPAERGRRRVPAVRAGGRPRRARLGSLRLRRNRSGYGWEWRTTPAPSPSATWTSAAASAPSAGPSPWCSNTTAARTSAHCSPR